MEKFLPTELPDWENSVPVLLLSSSAVWLVFLNVWKHRFKAMDMGNVYAPRLWRFSAVELRRRKLNWSELDEDTRNIP